MTQYPTAEFQKCRHLMHLPSGKCLGCGERHQPLSDYQPGDDETFIREHLSEAPAMRAKEQSHSPTGDDVERDTAWLIERSNMQGRYWSREENELPPRHWTDDHTLAVRFARKIDAEAMIERFSFGDARAIEHMWIATLSPNAPLSDGEYHLGCGGVWDQHDRCNKCGASLSSNGVSPEAADKLEAMQAALESVPIPGMIEPMPEFSKRMDEWLNTTYRDALNLNRERG